VTYRAGVASRAERATSFGAIADDYDRLRPRPPEAAVDWLLPEHCMLAIDLAAGTGLLTRALARKVPQVVAVEPDARMRAVLQARSPGVRVVQGVGEAIPMPDASADGVFVSSAWHWMDPERAVPEIARVLRDGGRFGVIWTSRDHSVDWIGELDWYREPGRRPRHEVTLPDTGLFGNIETWAYAFTQVMAVPDIVDMLATYSGVITASPQDRAAGLARARATLEQRFPSASQIEVPLTTWCWRADRADRADRAVLRTS
jgi:ubiquinone/menaquinone biosynthesis C-methylase UbiE